MRSTSAGAAVSPFKQPKAVFAVAFACVVSFMGIGLVDPVLPAISHELHASPSEVTLLFTSYLVVTAVAMLITNWVSSRLGAKKTLIAGLILIVVFSALAGASPSISGIIGFRAGWGVGNALFIATSLAVIVASASGGFAGAIVLYETALGAGIAAFGAPRLQATLGIAKTMYANLAAFAVVVLVIAIWTTDRAVLIPAVIISGIFIGVNNTVTTQAVMTVSPVEKPVASAAYGFVRFIGGGLAPYAAGRMVLAINIHFPFYIAVGAILAGIVILTTAHGLLSQAERVQAEQVTGSPTAAGEPEGPGPVGALIPVEAGPVEASTEAARPGARVILA